MSDFLGTFKTDVIFKDEIEQTLQPPSMYKVLLNNDDYTPMDFVVEVLQKYFSFDEERATQIMFRCPYSRKGSLWNFYCRGC